MDTPPRRGRAPSQGWPGRRVCRGGGTGRRLRREVPPPITPICLLSRCPCHRRGRMGLRDSAGTRLGPGDTDGLFAQRTCAEHSRILRTRARNRAPWANVLVLSESARTRGGRRTKRGTHEGQRRAASTPEKTDGHTQSDRGPSSAADGKPAKETGGTLSPERGDRGHSGGSVCQAEGTRRRGRPPRRAKQRRLGASGAALGGGTQLEDKAEPDAECPGGSAVLL